MSDALTVLITGGITLAAGLGTTWLNGRYNRSRDSDDRADRFQLEQRQAIVELLHAGTAWMDATFSSMVAVALADDDDDHDFPRRLEAAGAAEAVMVKALIAARLLINDPDLRSEFDELEATRRKASKCSNSNITASAKRVGNPLASLDLDTEQGQIEDDALAAMGPAVAEGNAAILRAREVLNNIERLANERLTP